MGHSVGTVPNCVRASDEVFSGGRQGGLMRFKIYTIAAAISTGLWIASYHAAQAGYHFAQTTGLMPSLHIRATLSSLFG